MIAVPERRCDHCALTAYDPHHLLATAGTHNQVKMQGIATLLGNHSCDRSYIEGPE